MGFTLFLGFVECDDLDPRLDTRPFDMVRRTTRNQKAAEYTRRHMGPRRSWSVPHVRPGVGTASPAVWPRGAICMLESLGPDVPKSAR